MLVDAYALGVLSGRSRLRWSGLVNDTQEAGDIYFGSDGIMRINPSYEIPFLQFSLSALIISRVKTPPSIIFVCIFMQAA